MTSSQDPTPQERLASSRGAILRYMTVGNEANDREGRHADHADASEADASVSVRGIWQSISRTVRVWWHHHPAQLAVDLATPVLNQYAKEKPYQLLGIAAATGVAIVLIRPWRLVSITGLAVAALKSSHASGLFLSLLSAHPEVSPHQKPQLKDSP